MMHEEKGYLEVSNFRKLLLVLSQVPMDPREALKEFVSNARDALFEAGISNGRVQIFLHRKGKRSFIQISDHGIGMDKTKLKYIATHLCDSDKLKKMGLEGHKAIGITSYLQLANECHIVSRPQKNGKSYCLILPTRADIEDVERSDGPTWIVREEEKRSREIPGTDVYLLGIDSEASRVLTMKKIADHLKNRYRSALLKGEFNIQICEGKRAEYVRPEKYSGEVFPISRIPTKWGFIDFNLYISPPSSRQRKVALVGEGGATIYDDISDLDEFDHLPWTSNQVEGEIRCPFLKPTTSRIGGVVRHREKFPIFLAAVKSIEENLSEEIKRKTKEYEERIDQRIFTHIRKIFHNVIKELEDLESPFKTPVASTTGEEKTGIIKDILDRIIGGKTKKDRRRKGTATVPVIDPTSLEKTKQQFRPLPSFYPKEFEENKSHLRSELDKDQGVIYYNDRHPDYLDAKRNPDHSYLLNYMLLIGVKEYVIYNNPHGNEIKISEEMIRFLSRARKHIPKQL